MLPLPYARGPQIVRENVRSAGIDPIDRSGPIGGARRSSLAGGSTRNAVTVGERGDRRDRPRRRPPVAEPTDGRGLSVVVSGTPPNTVPLPNRTAPGLPRVQRPETPPIEERLTTRPTVGGPRGRASRCRPMRPLRPDVPPREEGDEVEGPRSRKDAIRIATGIGTGAADVAARRTRGLEGRLWGAARRARIFIWDERPMPAPAPAERDHEQEPRPARVTSRLRSSEPRPTSRPSPARPRYEPVAYAPRAALRPAAGADHARERRSDRSDPLAPSMIRSRSTASPASPSGRRPEPRTSTPIR